MNRILEVSRADHGSVRLVDDRLPELARGQVRLRVERFAITANTVTYASVGDLLGYWDFYPSDDPAWGRVPAMGWAEVTESAHDDVAIGGRFYGWYPMAKYVDVAVSVTSNGLRDDGEHRARHASVYRTLEATDADPLYPRIGTQRDRDISDLEDRHAVLRGLFLTGYLAAAFFESHDWYGAASVVVLSASSKTSIGFATAARSLDGPAVVGVTSARNTDFVVGLERYDRVHTYDDIITGRHELTSVVIIDMAGNQPVVAALHEQLGDRIGYSMTVGMTHHDQPSATIVGGPTPTMFFAPTALAEMSNRGRNPREVQVRATTALAEFVEGSHDWLDIVNLHGGDAAANAWAATFAGTVAASEGLIVSMHETDESSHG